MKKYFELTTPYQLLGWLLLIFLLKFDTIIAPPVWDTAMGVFPPAAFLYDSGFDLAELVQQPHWWAGGPNVHTFSLWTWFISAVMTLTDSPVITFMTLHLITFAINALAISLFVQLICRYSRSVVLAITSGLLLLLTPLVLVQLGYMYTESIVMSFGIIAWSSWHNNCEGRAVLFALLALGIKLTAVAIVASLAIVLLLRLLADFSIKRLLLLLSLPSSLAIMLLLPGWLGAAENVNALSWGDPPALLRGAVKSLGRIPVISTFIFSGGVAAIVYALIQWRSTGWANPASVLLKHEQASGSRVMVLVQPFLFFAGIYASAFIGFMLLPRYLLPVLPFVIAQLVLLAQRFNSQGVLALIFAVACVASIYNHNGVLYSRSGAFSLVERSHAYQPYVLAQKTIIEEIKKLPSGVPIFVSREIDYMTSNRMMGYVEKENPEIFGIYKTQYYRLPIEKFPEEFYLVFTNSGHGGHRIKRAIEKAEHAKDWQINKIYQQRIGGYNMHIHHAYKL